MPISSPQGVPLRRTVYIGTFIHSKTLQELDICDNAAIGVDELGKIAFVERSAGNVGNVTAAHGWENAQLVRASDCQFFFPGFVG
jgi:guanine deaminase